jgi:hypothetical protein
MGLNWKDFPEVTKKTKLHKAVQKFFTVENYENGLWNLADVIADDDQRKYTVYKVLEGIQPNGDKRFDLAPRLLCKFEVLTRQACCRDKHGHTIWQNQSALELYGDDGDILPEFSDKPKDGDVVEWKGHRIDIDPDTDMPVDVKTLKKWALQGKRPNEYIEYVVKDGFIMVPYPHCLEMMTRKGFKGSKPRFRKVNIKDSRRRRMTNWWFKEVPPGTKKRKQRSDAGQPRGPKEEAPTNPTA